MKYLIKDNFTNGEFPEGGNKSHVWTKGTEYSGSQAEALMMEQLLEEVPGEPVDPVEVEAPAPVEAPKKGKGKKAE